MPIVIDVPRITSAESPREILAHDFPSLGTLPIRGGWGYTREDATIIDRDDPVVPKGTRFDGLRIESAFVEKRIYEELIIVQNKAGRYSGIAWKRLKQSLHQDGGRSFDLLRVEVTALPDKDWEELRAEWEGPAGCNSPDFDAQAHLAKRDSRTIRYETDYWFDITSFFGIR